MKIKQGFIMNKVGSQYVVVPVGEASKERHCMVRLNGTGAFLWEKLQEESSEEDLAAAVLEAFDAPADAVAGDVAVFLKTLRDADLLDE